MPDSEQFWAAHSNQTKKLQSNQSNMKIKDGVCDEARGLNFPHQRSGLRVKGITYTFGSFPEVVSC